MRRLVVVDFLRYTNDGVPSFLEFSGQRGFNVRLLLKNER